MTDVLTDLDARERRAVRHLARLFRIERGADGERRPAAATQRLLARRAALIDEVIALDAQRRSNGVPDSQALDAALHRLADELPPARDHALARLRQLEAELRSRRGDRASTGLRGSAGGQLLGRG